MVHINIETGDCDFEKNHSDEKETRKDDATMENGIEKESLNVHADKGDDSSVKGHTIDAGHESMQRNDSSDSEEGSEDNVKEKLGGRKINTPSFRTARGGKQPRILLDRGPMKITCRPCTMLY